MPQTTTQQKPYHYHDTYQTWDLKKVLFLKFSLSFCYKYDFFIYYNFPWVLQGDCI